MSDVLRFALSTDILMISFELLLVVDPHEPTPGTLEQRCRDLAARLERVSNCLVPPESR